MHPYVNVYGQSTSSIPLTVNHPALCGFFRGVGASTQLYGHFHLFQKAECQLYFTDILKNTKRAFKRTYVVLMCSVGCNETAALVASKGLLELHWTIGCCLKE